MRTVASSCICTRKCRAEHDLDSCRHISVAYFPAGPAYIPADPQHDRYEPTLASKHQIQSICIAAVQLDMWPVHVHRIGPAHNVHVSKKYQNTQTATPHDQHAQDCCCSHHNACRQLQVVVFAQVSARLSAISTVVAISRLHIFQPTPHIFQPTPSTTDTSRH